MKRTFFVILALLTVLVLGVPMLAGCQNNKKADEQVATQEETIAETEAEGANTQSEGENDEATVVYQFVGDPNTKVVLDCYADGSCDLIYTGMGTVTSGTWSIDDTSDSLPVWTIELDETFENQGVTVETDNSTKFYFNFKNESGQLDLPLVLSFDDYEAASAASTEKTETTQTESVAKKNHMQADNVQTYPDSWDWTLPENATRDDEIKMEIAHAKYVRNRPHAYEKTWFYEYYEPMNNLINIYNHNNGKIPEQTQALFEKAVAIRKKKVQIQEDPEKDVWYIWGDSIPQEDAVASYDYSYSYDDTDFVPILIPYMLEDQSQVKGNIIVIAGGGFFSRANHVEGYPIAEAFNERGYNAFVLQRRVSPSQPIDSGIDLQRSIRYIRYNADKLGIKETDKIATIGFSGGGMTILHQVQSCYGDITPDDIYASYTPDSVDAVNSDYQVMMLMYTAKDDFVSENTKLPAAFITTGQKDTTLPAANSLKLYNALEDKVSVEMHIYPDAPHGYGIGTGTIAGVKGYRGADQWLESADVFLQVEFGLTKRTY